MRLERAGGILLHPTSLPGFGGIGSIGPAAFRWVDALAGAGMSLWQVLPLGPTGYADSPYSALSALAGNPFLISLEPLVEQNLLTPEDLRPLEGLPESHVDFGRLVPAKMAVLRRAFERFRLHGDHEAVGAFAAQNADWLEDFVLYMAIKDAHSGGPWYDWEPDLRRRDEAALAAASERLADDRAFHRFVQYLFFTQWSALKAHAAGRDIRIIGDIPIFVAHDSSDVWANQRLFQLDDEGQPLVVAGVPPDYFSETGQLWGNPHYRWDVMAAEGYRWWIERFRMLLRLVDIVRLDHFRGFAGAWHVPFGETTAVKGEWVPGPGAGMFDAVLGALGDVPIIAEDLGVITEDVVQLRERYGFPGMTILQFAFGSGSDNPGLLHNLTRDTVAYTGTHDNDTTVGWFSSLPGDTRCEVTAYTGTTGSDISWDLVRLAIASVAILAVVPLQDVLRLGPAARMNLPGRPEGNWSWRFLEGDVHDEHIHNLRSLIRTYGRGNDTDRGGAGVGPTEA